MSNLRMALIFKIRFSILAAILAGFAAVPVQCSEKDGPVVRAVLFTSPTCPHCAKVKEEVLPPLVERFGTRLQIANISTVTQTGHELFLSACMKHGLLKLSVPLLVIGNVAVVGSEDIPARFPGLIEKNLAAGGIGWPNIPGFAALLAANTTSAVDTDSEPATAAASTATALSPASASGVADAAPQEKPSSTRTAPAVDIKPKAPPAMVAGDPIPAPPSSPVPQGAGNSGTRSPLPVPSSPKPADTPEASANSALRATDNVAPATNKTTPSGIIDLTEGMEEMGVLDRIKRDIYGNGLAILVLAGMIVALGIAPIRIKRSAVPKIPEIKPRYDWLIPILVLAGLGVAAYLSHVEVQKVEAVCGPVGDCNTVNQSEYARLFGIIPIGVLGFIGFLAILVAWTLRRWGSNKMSLRASVGLLAMTAFGTIFSIYLTFLEPFVIGATCLWCLSSAVIMTTLFVLALEPGWQAWSALKKRPLLQNAMIP